MHELGERIIWDRGTAGANAQSRSVLGVLKKRKVSEPGIEWARKLDGEEGQMVKDVVTQE